VVGGEDRTLLSVRTALGKLVVSPCLENKIQAKNSKLQKAGGIVQVTECLPSMCEAPPPPHTQHTHTHTHTVVTYPEG
jgi:hypothetical protein